MNVAVSSVLVTVACLPTSFGPEVSDNFTRDTEVAKKSGMHEMVYVNHGGDIYEPIVPARENGEVVLFDAAKHGPEVFRNYTASWKEGSNLVPVMKPVTKDGEKFIEISYEKERGTAISLIRFESLPEPASWHALQRNQARHRLRQGRLQSHFGCLQFL